jgi:long-chain acyl-CoA synthetase
MISAARPHRWERSYPPGVVWDTPIERSTLPALLEGAVRIYGERIALKFRNMRITYRRLGELVDRAAAGFGRLGVGPGVTVALYLTNSPFYPIAFFGVLRAGGRVVNISPLDAGREIAHKLTDSHAEILVTLNSSGLYPTAAALLETALLERAGLRYLVIGDDAEWGSPAGATVPVPRDDRHIAYAELIAEPGGGPWPEIGVEDVALLQYTGGTTGIPKGAMLSHGNLSAAVSIYDIWGIGQSVFHPGEERILCVLPLFHIFALTAVLLRHLKNGSEILLHQRFDVDAVLRDIHHRRPTLFSGVPTMYMAIVNHPKVEQYDLSSLRFCTSGGAPLPVEIGLQFERLTGRRLIEGWGMTETAPAGTNTPVTGPSKPGTIGLPLPGIVMEVVALDDPLRVLGPGERGEICIAGPNVMAGYWRNPAATEEAFAGGRFHTGDIGYQDEDGYFFLVDRKKDMILSGGFNVYPRVIEEALYEHPDVEEAVVIGVPDPYRGQSAKAFLKLRPGAVSPSLEDLRVFLADRIGRHEMPAAVEIRSSLPRTAVGKLSKKELVEEERLRAVLRSDPPGR